MAVTDTQKAASYLCELDRLLKAAYQRDFSMLEMGKCKIKYPTSTFTRSLEWKGMVGFL